MRSLDCHTFVTFVTFVNEEKHPVAALAAAFVDIYFVGSHTFVATSTSVVVVAVAVSLLDLLQLGKRIHSLLLLRV